MTLPRATLLLLFLPALACAAPAPLPRDKRHPEWHPWSAPVDGLSIRLLAKQKRYRADDPIRLVLEVRNVGDSPLTLEAPVLSREVDRPNDRSPGWRLTGERKDREDERLLYLLMRPLERRPAQGLVRLEAGGALRVEIVVTRGGDDEGDQKGGRQHLRFLDLEAPAAYELRAVFSRHPKGVARKGVWNGESLKSPPVRIEIEP